MSPALSREERDAIRARAEAAMDGPWRFRLYHGEWQAVDQDGVPVAVCELDADAEFIAHARTDVPALLDALDAAEEQNERLRRENDALRTEKIAAKSRAGAAEAEVAALRGRIEGLASRWDTLSGDMLRGALAAAEDENDAAGQ